MRDPRSGTWTRHAAAAIGAALLLVAAGCGGKSSGKMSTTPPPPPPPTGGDIWWISTTGSDSNGGKAIDDAFATFHKALSAMAAGDTLYIDDGVYHDSIGAVGGNYSPWSEMQGPNGVSSSQRTKILGFNPHAVVIDGGGKEYPLSIFRAQHLEIGNIVVLHGKLDGPGSSSPADVQQSDDIYLHQVGAAYPDPTCTDCQGISVEDATNVVIEECWAWGYGARYGISLYGGAHNTVRRSVVRYDGSVDGEPKSAYIIYSEDQSLMENNVALDFDAASDSSDDVHTLFYTTASVSLSPPSFPPGLPTALGSASWYGNIAVNTIKSPEGIMFFDSHVSIGGTVTAVDNVLENGTGFQSKGNSHGIWVSEDDGPPRHSQITLSHNTVVGIDGDGIRVDAPPAWPAVEFDDNLIANLAPTSQTCFTDVSGSGTRITASDNEVFGCAGLTVPNDSALSTADPKLSYALRAEPGTPAAGSGKGGTNRGATVEKRYLNGTVTGDGLWPFPNEDAIKQDFCAGPDGTMLNGVAINTRGHNGIGWCASGKSLTEYVWGQLGNPSPY